MIHSISLGDLHETGLTSIQKELKVVQLLFDISQMLNKSLSIEASMHSVLRKMAEEAGMNEGAITIVNSETGQVEVNLAYGISGEDPSRCKTRHEITNRVIETGVPAVVEDFTKKPQFLDVSPIPEKKPGRRTMHAVSYLVAPIQGPDGIIGAIGTDRLFRRQRSVEEDVRLLARISILLVDAIEIRRQARKQEFLLEARVKHLQSEIMDRFNPAGIIGHSHAIRKVHQLIHQVASSRSNVLITGEAGTGKELVARAIHRNSPQSQKPFIRVSLAAMSPYAIGGELFGSGPGKLVGTGPKGCFETAKGGTLFLDEISHLPAPVQTGLIHVLQGRGSGPPDNSSALSTEVRIISATDRDLEKMVQNSEFRPDLFYRLSAFPILVPPLRERKTDILLLADHFLKRDAQAHAKSISRISAHSIDRMMSYHWPGNVRELENCMEQAVQSSDDGVIHAHHLPLSLQTAETIDADAQWNLPASVAAFEQDMLVDALRLSRGNPARAAKLLGVDELFLIRRVKQYGLDFKRFKPPNDWPKVH